MLTHVLALVLACQPPPAMPEVTHADLARFPPAKVVRHNREVARCNLERLRARKSIDQRWQVDAAIEEQQFAFVCWDTLDTALCSTADEDVLDALHALRHHLKPALYYVGHMPPLHPRWWFPDDEIPRVRGPDASAD